MTRAALPIAIMYRFVGTSQRDGNRTMQPSGAAD